MKYIIIFLVLVMNSLSLEAQKIKKVQVGLSCWQDKVIAGKVNQFDFWRTTSYVDSLSSIPAGKIIITDYPYPIPGYEDREYLYLIPPERDPSLTSQFNDLANKYLIHDIYFELLDSFNKDKIPKKPNYWNFLLDKLKIPLMYDDSLFLADEWLPEHKIRHEYFQKISALLWPIGKESDYVFISRYPHHVEWMWEYRYIHGFTAYSTNDRLWKAVDLKKMNSIFAAALGYYPRRAINFKNFKP